MVHKKMRSTRHSGAEILAGSQSDVEEDSAQYIPLELSQKPERMLSENITTYIRSLSEYTQWLDLWSLTNTCKEDCQHHFDILAEWREVRESASFQTWLTLSL